MSAWAWIYLIIRSYVVVAGAVFLAINQCYFLSFICLLMMIGGVEKKDDKND